MKEALEKIYSSKSRTFLAFCSFFILGSALASLFGLPQIALFLYSSLFVLVGVLVIYWSHLSVKFILLCIFFLNFGIWRFSVSNPNCNDNQYFCHYNGTRPEFIGVINDEPEIKTNEASYIITVKTVEGKSVSGKVLSKNSRFPEYKFGDELKISCNLESPQNTAGSNFKYDKYLARIGIWSICQKQTIEKISDHKGNIILEKIYTFKTLLSIQLERLWKEPEASLMAGLLYGSKSSLPKNILGSFSSTGVSHVVAVSGFNITIIVVSIMWLLIALGLYRQQAFYVVTCIAILFVVFTGLSASAVRAGIMGILVLSAKQVGRGSRVLNLLVFTLALMQMFNPYFLVWDVGFQLSFLALLGLVYLLPVLNSLVKTPEKYDFIKEPLFTTMSAIIITLPLLLYQFGSLSVVAPLTNMLILWIIPWIMLAGAVSIASSFIFFPLGQVIAFVAHLCLSYVIMIVQFLGNLPFAKMNIEIPLWLMFGMYGAITVIARRVATKQSHKI